MAHTIDGNISDWLPTERLDTSRTGTPNHALYATLEGDQYIFAIQAPSAIGTFTTLWLNTDRNEATGAVPYQGAGTGAEYYIDFATDGLPYLFSGSNFGTNLSVSPLNFAYGSGNTIVEIALPVSLIGGAGNGFDLKVDVNNGAFMPYDFNLFKYSVTPNFYYTLFGKSTHDIHGFGGQVYSIYSGLLGRAPDDLGLEFWADQLEHGASIRDLGKQFLFSAEGQARAGSADNATFVQQLYQATLNRPADSAGLDYWTGKLNQGVERVDVALGFTFSNEHLDNLQSVFDAGLFVPDKQAADVSRLYYTMLNRAPDAGGLKFWTDQLDHGGSLSSLAQGFLASAESQTKYAALENAAYVDALYMNAFSRHAEPGGLQFWTDQLNSGVSRADLAVQLTNSAEAMAVHLSQIEQGWFLS